MHKSKPRDFKKHTKLWVICSSNIQNIFGSKIDYVNLWIIAKDIIRNTIKAIFYLEIVLRVFWTYLKGDSGRFKKQKRLKYKSYAGWNVDSWFCLSPRTIDPLKITKPRNMITTAICIWNYAMTRRQLFIRILQRLDKDWIKSRFLVEFLNISVLKYNREYYFSLQVHVCLHRWKRLSNCRSSRLC